MTASFPVITGNKKSLLLNRSIIMGVLNVTPDSFSDGGRFDSIDAALKQAELMLKQGADIIDVGGESTRPNAKAVSIEDELQRTAPIIEAIQKRFDTFVSIDTSKPEVMRAAADAGANLINDVRALTLDGALQAVSEIQLPVCLMHMKGQPDTMQNNPQYSDVVNEVVGFLNDRVNACLEVGIPSDKILLDPGFGFGKTVEHNYQLLEQLSAIVEMNYSVLVGMSRKSMIGAVTGAAVEERLIGSITLATIAAMKGAHIFRVHDVAQTREALALVDYMQQSTAI